MFFDQKYDVTFFNADKHLVRSVTNDGEGFDSIFTTQGKGRDAQWVLTIYFPNFNDTYLGNRVRVGIREEAIQFSDCGSCFGTYQDITTEKVTLSYKESLLYPGRRTKISFIFVLEGNFW